MSVRPILFRCRQRIICFLMCSIVCCSNVVDAQHQDESPPPELMDVPAKIDQEAAANKHSLSPGSTCRPIGGADSCCAAASRLSAQRLARMARTSYYYSNPIHQADLFYNYYVSPVCGGAGARMYVSPGPVPEYVGQTYYTYQPLYPHEYMYHHSRTYHRHYHQGMGLNRTIVRYRRDPIQMISTGLKTLFEPAR